MYLFELVFAFPLDKYPGVELLGYMVVLFLIFGGFSILLSTVDAPVSIPTNSIQGSLCFTSLPMLVICCIFDNSYSDRCEVISHCGFDSQFPDA